MEQQKSPNAFSLKAAKKIGYMLASEAFAKTEHGADGRFVSNGSDDSPSLSALNREHRKIQAEVDALRAKAEAVVRRGGTATKSPMKHPVHAKLKAAEARLQASKDAMKARSQATTASEALAKVMDAEGHEHGSDGKFTSSGGAGKARNRGQAERAAKIKAMTEAGEITPADPGSNCHECGGYPDILDGLRPHPKAKYKVDGQNVCGTHVLRVAEGRDAYWNDKTGRYQGTKVDNHMMIGSDGAIGIVSGKQRGPGVSASKAEKDAAKKAERLAREKAANDKKLAKPCKRSQPIPEHMRSVFKPDTDFSGRGPRGKFMCIQHMLLNGDHNPHDIDFENDDDTRCRIAARYDKEHS